MVQIASQPTVFSECDFQLLQMFQCKRFGSNEKVIAETEAYFDEPLYKKKASKCYRSIVSTNKFEYFT